MSNVSKMIEWVLSKINSGLCKYSQDGNKRWGNIVDGYQWFDCSSLMITALKNIGVDVHNANYTGNMKNIANDPNVICYDFEDLYNSNGCKLKPGDILVYHKSSNIGHTVMYLGNGQIGEAKGTKYGLCVSPFYRGSWQYVLRVIDDTVATPVAPVTSSTEVRKEYIEVKTVLVKKGVKSAYVKTLQILLNAKDNAKLEVDGSCGSLTTQAIRNYQAKHGLVIDGECGVNTWNSIISL